MVFSVWPASGRGRLGRALLASSGLSSLVHRHKYDVSLPTPSERDDRPDDARTPPPEKPRSVETGSVWGTGEEDVLGLGWD